MNKNKILLVADSSILNPKITKPISKLSVSYTIYLHSLLYLNWMEILSEFNKECDVACLLSSYDKDFISKDFFQTDSNFFFLYHQNKKNLIEEVQKNLITNNSKILIIFHNSIGIKKSYIERIFNLVHPEEASIVIARSNRQKIILGCYNSGNEMVNPLLKSKRDYTKYLNLSGNQDIFIHTLNGFLSIDDFEDIKNLYIELSKKESISYCSSKMHENFNDLFVEYKELLNA